MSTTPTNRGQNSRSPGSTLPRTVWKPHPHKLMTDWLRRMEPAAAGGDKFSSPHLISFHITYQVYNSNNPGMKTYIPRVDTAPQGVETPTLLAYSWLDWVHGTSSRRGNCRPRQRRGLATPGDDKAPPPDLKKILKSTNPITRRQKRTSPWWIPPRKVWKWLARDHRASARRELPHGTTARSRLTRGR